MIEIKARYRGARVEVIDTAEDEQEADYLLENYRLAFGAVPGQPNAGDWQIWAARKNARVEPHVKPLTNPSEER